MPTVYPSLADLATHGLPAGALAGIPTADQEKALAAASDEADGYLRAAGYTLPLASWGETFTQKVTHLAQWHLMARRGFNPDAPIDRLIRTRYEDAVKWFKAIGRGVDPGVVDSTPAADEGGASVVTNARRRWLR